VDNNASASCPNGFASADPIRPLPRSPKARDRGHPQLDKIGSMRPGPPAKLLTLAAKHGIAAIA